MKIITKRVKSRFRQCLYPYEGYHSPGFHIDCNTGRRLISLLPDVVNDLHKPKTTISYARYLWEAAHHRKVREGYEIDHIDGDCTNDTIENLQEISVPDNRKKAVKDPIVYNRISGNNLFLWCPVCGERFKISRWKVNLKKLKKGKEFHYCCRECTWESRKRDFIKPKTQKFSKIKQIDFTPANQYEDFKKFSKPIYEEKQIKVCDCGNIIHNRASHCSKCIKKQNKNKIKIIHKKKKHKVAVIRYCLCGNKLNSKKAKYCCKECRIKYGDNSNSFKVDKEKLIKYCKISMKKFGRYNYSWIGRKLGVSDNAVKKNIVKYKL